MPVAGHVTPSQCRNRSWAYLVAGETLWRCRGRGAAATSCHGGRRPRKRPRDPASLAPAPDEIDGEEVVADGDGVGGDSVDEATVFVGGYITVGCGCDLDDSGLLVIEIDVIVCLFNNIKY
mmetsp:Transcript_138/g.331  ORF Transcript_138/g.331 Transcript_138/m.331 type:complete len:121 (-) Transcript_138:121-483(-)